MYTRLMIQVFHRRRMMRRLRRGMRVMRIRLTLPKLARGLVGVAAERRITFTVDGTVSRRVHPFASAFAARVQSTDHVDLLVGVVTGCVVAVAVQAELTEGVAEGAAGGAASRRRFAARLPFGAQRRQVHRYALKQARAKHSFSFHDLESRDPASLCNPLPSVTPSTL